MRIKSIEVDNFLSLKNFDMELSKFTCLIGLNSSGKTNVLLFFDFLKHLMTNSIDEFLGRNYLILENIPFYTCENTKSDNMIISFGVVFDENGEEYFWECEYDTAKRGVTNEFFRSSNGEIIHYTGARNLLRNLYKIFDCDKEKQFSVNFNFSGSILSTLKENIVPEGILKIKNFISNIFPVYNFKKYKPTPIDGAWLYDEIENGIDIDTIESIANDIQKIDTQIICTTHSPVFLNYIDDDIAEKTVQYIYKNEYKTKCVPFFSIQSIKEKLTIMNSGEVFADTILSELNKTLA